MPLSALQAAKLPPWFSPALHCHNRSLPITLAFRRRFQFVSPSCHASVFPQIDDVDDHVVGDCLVFEDGIFEDPYLQNDIEFSVGNTRDDHVKPKKTKKRMSVKRRDEAEIFEENLVPEEWRHIQEEVNLSKKERRKIAQQLEFGVKVEKKRQGLVPLRNLDLKEYLKYKEEKMNQLKPLVLDNPSNFPSKDDAEDPSVGETRDSSSSSVRVEPKNPRWAAYGRGFDDVTEFFNSGDYDPDRKKSDGPRKLFTKEEKVLLNSRIPDLAVATSGKWLPLHTLAASGEFYLVDLLLKHNVDINAVDKNGLSALHRAIIGKKQAITSYLLRESANPFIIDEEGATLMHYAVQTSSAPTIKLLLLYNVKIDQPDNDGWTPLHVAVQARRTDMVKLLLIKGADKTVRNKDGLTPLDICLYSGRDIRTYELIKLLKEFPSRSRVDKFRTETRRIEG